MVSAEIKLIKSEYKQKHGEAFFNNNVSPKNLNKASLRIMKDIDKADLIDSNIGTIQTPYGITSIDSLSTGCKTVINYIVIASNCEIYKDVKAIYATECGWNALEELFEQIESIGYDIGVIIEHDNKLYNIGRIHNFWSRDIISKTNVRCMRKGIRFAYTKYYCFEELYLSYSELMNMYQASGYA